MTKPIFVLLSFEGPDPYSRAGGLGTRMAELSAALARMDLETHLVFIGDPNMPGHELREGGRLHLHRWCQWISTYHSGGVYEGEEGKLWDWNRSLPPWLEKEVLAPAIAQGGQVVVLAEEWQTAASTVAISRRLRQRGWQSQVQLLWNANNTFSFDRMDWQALQNAAVLTTVSRYMKHQLAQRGVDARVIPNGIPDGWFQPPNRGITAEFRTLFAERVPLVKVARWDPDKRWNMAVEAVGGIKRLGLRPVMIARGGIEPYGAEILGRAQEQGLSVAFATASGDQPRDILQAITGVARDSDLIVLDRPLSQSQCQTLYHAADATLANSGSEPFGLVGLEAMASGGMAFVGSTGEDYVTPGHDAVSLQTADSREIVHHLAHFRARPDIARRMRSAARRSAGRYTWNAVLRRVLFPALREIGVAMPIEENGQTTRDGGEADAYVQPGRAARITKRAGSLHGPKRPAKQAGGSDAACA